MLKEKKKKKIGKEAKENANKKRFNECQWMGGKSLKTDSNN